MSEANQEYPVQIRNWQLQIHAFGHVIWINIVLIMMTLGLILGGLYWYLSTTKKVDVLWNTGKVSYRINAIDPTSKLEKSSYPEQTLFQTGDFVSPLEGADFLALDYGNGFYALLQPRSEIQLLETNDTQKSFQILGQCQLAIENSEGEEGKTFLINGMRLAAKQAQAMFIIGKDHIYISMLQGELQIPAQKGTPEMKLQAGDSMILNSIGLPTKSNVITPKNSWIPDFHQLSTFQPVGILHGNTNSVQLVRNNKTRKITAGTFLISGKDKILNLSDENVTLVMQTGDVIRIYPQGELRINSKTAEDLRNANYSFTGRIQAAITRYTQNRKVEFKSKFASIKTTGTNAVITSSPENTEVFSLFGEVTLSDKKGASVVIPMGMMSKADGMNPPAAPMEIPAQQFALLQKESFGLQPGPKLLSKHQKRLKRLTLGDTLQWDYPLFKAHLNVADQWVRLPFGEDPRSITLSAPLLETLSVGFYSVLLRAENHWGGKTLMGGILKICGETSIGLNETRRDKISQFQAKNNILVDGVIGPETRLALEKIIQCRAQ